MQYEDRLTIATPEGVTMQVTLAGAGSRIAAAVIDGLIQIAALLVLLLILVGVFPDAEGGDETFTDFDGTGSFFIALAIFNVLLFLILFFYFVIFETLWSGRSPGKKALGLRVVRVGGGPVGFKASAVRNLMRIVDILPSMYAVGIITILVNGRNQRLGDIVAGTIVMRDREVQLGSPVHAPASEELPPELATWDVSAVTQEELVAVRRFLERRYSLDYGARTRLAEELAKTLLAKVAGVTAQYTPEEFLEKLAIVKAARS